MEISAFSFSSSGNNLIWKKNAIIDGFTSVIWTERYATPGDITLTIPSNHPMMSYLVEGAFLGYNRSQELMLVDTVSIENGIATITGDTLTGFLASRIFRDTWKTAANSSTRTGTPAAIAMAMVSDALYVNGSQAGYAYLPGTPANETLSAISFGTTAPGTSLTTTVDFADLLAAIEQVCALDNTGFNLLPVPLNQSNFAGVVFNTYKGVDRTTRQSLYKPVLFDTGLDNFTGVTKLRSIRNYRTVAYSFPANATAQSQIGIAYASGAAATDIAFARRSLFVDASDSVDVNNYTSNATGLTAVLNQKAANALANNNYVRSVDGQLVLPNLQYRYGIEYNLGDIIELRDGSTSSYAMVTEFIRSEDNTGTSMYPTLSLVA